MILRIIKRAHVNVFDEHIHRYWIEKKVLFFWVKYSTNQNSESDREGFKTFNEAAKFIQSFLVRNEADITKENNRKYLKTTKHLEIWKGKIKTTETPKIIQREDNVCS